MRRVDGIKNIKQKILVFGQKNLEPEYLVVEFPKLFTRDCHSLVTISLFVNETMGQQTDGHRTSRGSLRTRYWYLLQCKVQQDDFQHTFSCE